MVPGLIEDQGESAIVSAPARQSAILTTRVDFILADTLVNDNAGTTSARI
jgi:hypothetical protein